MIRERLLSGGSRAAGTRLGYFLFCLACSIFVSACTSVPAGRAAVRTVELSGNDTIDADELREKIATADSPRFLGFFQGIVYDYNVFDRFVLERDLQRLERYYRARGFYQTRVRAGRVFFEQKNKVRVEIVIEEGARVLVRRVDFHGLESIDEQWVKDITRRVKRRLCGRNLCQTPLDRPFEEDAFKEAAETLQHALGDHGYAYATVQRSADVDLPHNRVAVGFFGSLGPKSRFGDLTIVGLGKVPEAPVRRAINLDRGAPYSREELDLAERALLDMNVFSSVIISPELSQGQEKTGNGEAVVPIRVTVETAKLKSIHVGGGAELSSLQTDVHLLGGWEHRNLFGGLRSLIFEVRPGVVLYPTRFPGLKAPTNFLPEGRFNAQFRQPGFLEPRANFFTRLDGSVAPVILSPKDTSGNVLGYGDVRISPGIDRSFNGTRLYGSLSHTLQVDAPFAYLGKINEFLRLVVISYPELLLTFDLRDQQVHPHAGLYATTDLQVAGVGGDAIDVKTQNEIRGYLPVARRWTLAARVRVGFLFPQNYGGTILDAANRRPVTSDQRFVEDTELVFLRGFFAGGPGSNRGYALREIGPHAIVQQGSSTLATCRTGDVATMTCEQPLGGFSLWEAALELRFPISGPFTGAFFTDTADVSAKQMDLRLNRPHLSVGIGFRYDTPVGPIRFDAGYRVPGLQAPASAVDEGAPQTLLGQPIALSFGIGEAF